MSATAQRLREVEQFLYREARLMDARRFEEWLELFADDLRYWMPAQASRYAANSGAIAVQDAGRYAAALAQQGELALLDETKGTLAMRVARLRTGTAWAEEPPSRTRRFVTNIEIEGDGDEFTVYSNFMLYRNRLETEQDFYVGRRIDRLRVAEGGLRIASRTIILDQNVLLAKNLCGLF